MCLPGASGGTPGGLRDLRQTKATKPRNLKELIEQWSKDEYTEVGKDPNDILVSEKGVQHKEGA